MRVRLSAVAVLICAVTVSGLCGLAILVWLSTAADLVSALAVTAVASLLITALVRIAAPPLLGGGGGRFGIGRYAALWALTILTLLTAAIGLVSMELFMITVAVLAVVDVVAARSIRDRRAIARACTAGAVDTDTTIGGRTRGPAAVAA